MEEVERDCILAQDDWVQVNGATALLAPMLEATEEMSREKYVTSSKLIPMMTSCIEWYGAEARKQI